MLKRSALPALLVAIIATGVVAEFLPASPAGAGAGSTGQSDAVANVAARRSLTARAVSAARAFEASLSAAQRAAVQFSFSSAKKSGWSILPTNLRARNGVAIKDLDARERARLRTLLRTIMSARGYSDEVAVRRADTYLEHHPAQAGNRAQHFFDDGEGLYYVAIFGSPSRSKKWTVQFDGHHYTLNMTFSGTSVSNTPYFIGVNPPTAFRLRGRTYAPMVDEVAGLFGAVGSLDASQRAAARLSQSFDDVLVGEGDDGRFPPRQGIRVSTLSRAQRRLVTRALRSYVGAMPHRQAARRIAVYRKEYARTRLAWSGSTNPTTPGAYVRIHGPRIWIEIVLQEGQVAAAHYHSIERDIEDDYGTGP